MTEYDLKDLLSKNIKKYRKGIFTKETLAEKIGVSCQNINDIEEKRRFPCPESLVKIADALNVKVYQLFVPENALIVVLEETPESRRRSTRPPSLHLAEHSLPENIVYACLVTFSHVF